MKRVVIALTLMAENYETTISPELLKLWLKMLESYDPAVTEQAVLNVMAGERYKMVTKEFRGMIHGDYGKTPVEIDPEFRLKIAGTREAIPYDTSKNQRQPNPVLEDAGGVRLAENEKEELLLELFPAVAKDYLTKVKTERWAATKPTEAPKAEE